tara:strand:- start:1788 stop:2840 length:1053 start_codon:yes stop_codon:yes gene_type:complete
MKNYIKPDLNENQSKCMLFISFTNNHNKTIMDLIETIINEVNKENLFLITTTTNTPSLFLDHNVFKIKLEKKILYILNQILTRSIKNNIENFLNKKMESFKFIEILSPQLINILPNFVVHKLYYNKQNVVISNYPDGIGQLINQKIQWSRRGDITYYKIFLRYIIANFMGLRYRWIFGNLLSSYIRLDKIYTYVPNLIPQIIQKNTKVIKIKALKKQITGQNILLIFYSSEDSIEQYLELFYKKIIDSKKEIYYKPHPAYSNDAFIKFIKKEKAPIKILNKNENLEECVEKYNCNKVISIGAHSTIFVNLRLIYGEKIHLILFEYEHLLAKQNKRLDEIFNYLKVSKYKI